MRVVSNKNLYLFKDLKRDETRYYLKHSVRETSRGLIFPSLIAQERGSRRTIATLIVSGTFLVIGSAFSDDDWLLYIINSLAGMISIGGGVELMSRVCAVFEEKSHIVSRYDNKLLNLICDIFSFTLASFITILASCLTLLLTYFISNKNPFAILFNEKPIPTGAALISVLLLRNILKLEQSPLNESLQIYDLKGLDYGSGMAHSFFHGYLRIVLPHSGREQDKGIKEFLQDYEARNDIKFDEYKLFILIPFSQHCPPSLSNNFSPTVEVCKELDSKEVDRAGVKNRNYKNSVYKITTGKSRKRTYVSAEYATPVKTLHEVMKQNTPCSYLYNKHRVDILLNFYRTLRSLLMDDPDCRDVCEPIYYNDRDEKGNYHDVGLIILARIKQLKRKKC